MESAVRRILLAVVTPSLLVSVAAAQGAPTQAPPHAIVVMADQVNWGPGPAALPPGAKAAVLEGNPKEPGPFTMRLSFPDGYRIPAHSHPAVERVTVIEGTMQVGMGDKFDEAALTTLPAGTFAALQPGTRHFAQAKGNTIIQLNGTGPWKLNYVNPADDPRKK
jgi:quercetin dioxygenase-like cupin family protein